VPTAGTARIARQLFSVFNAAAQAASSVPALTVMAMVRPASFWQVTV